MYFWMEIVMLSFISNLTSQQKDLSSFTNIILFVYLADLNTP